MKRSDIRDKLATEMGIQKNEADRIVLSFLDAIMQGANADGRVVIQNFGSFQVKQGRARKAIKPGTGETLHVPAKRKIRFVAGKNFANKVNADCEPIPKWRRLYGGMQPAGV